MKVGWEVSKFGDVCAIELGKTPSRADSSYWDVKKQTNNIWLSIADLLNTENSVVSGSKEYLSDKGAKVSKKVAAGTLLVSFKLTLGRLAYTGCDLFTNEAIAALTIHNEKKLTKEFLYYFLMHFDWDKACDGDVKVKGKTLNKAKLKEIAIFYPNYSEQQRIVTILDEAFEQIAIARANTEKNLQNARALFESHLQSVFTQRGEGWIEKTLNEVCQIKPPKSEARSQLNKSDLVSFAPMEDLGINQKYLSATKLRTLEEVSGSYTYFADGDVLLAKITPCFENGKLGIAKDLKNAIGFGSSEYIVFRPYKDLLNEYLYYFLARKQFLEDGAVRMSGAVGHKRVSKEFIEEHTISFPSIELQKMIVEKIDALSEETQRLEFIYQRKLTMLDELKKSLLHKAFAGEL